MLQICSNKSSGWINVKLIYAKINNVLTIYHYFEFFLYHYFDLVFYGIQYSSTSKWLKELIEALKLARDPFN